MTEETEQQHQVWLRSGLDLDGQYRPVLEITDDLAVPLDRELALAHAEYVLAMCVRVEYDARVFRQNLRATNGNLEALAELLDDLRAVRSPLMAPTPLALQGGVTMEGKPFLHVAVIDEMVGQWEIEDAKTHAHVVLEVLSTAELDNQYFTLLTTGVGLPDSIARSVVARLGEH